MENVSHTTILSPRNDSYGSSRLNTDFILQLETPIDREKWEDRKEFLYHSLAFCLSLPNLWRFPREAFIHGQAAFVWIYIVLMISVGSALLFLEVVLGQFSSKGLTKVFSMCPLFEGISYSMAVYCGIVSIYYGVLSTYSFIYVFASFNSTLEYSSCESFPKEICHNKSVQQNVTPEMVFFDHRIVYYSSNSYDVNATPSKLNLRNIGILFFLWMLVSIAILKGIRTTKWPAMIYCPIPYIVLTLTLISAMNLKGAEDGIAAMFSIHFYDALDLRIWRYALEQTILAIGLGMGPLITLGSYSKFHSPADRDCFALCICTMVGSLLSGSVFFATLGVLAYERNQTMSIVLNQNNPYHGVLDISAHAVFSQLFTRLDGTMSHVGSFLFFFGLALAGWYSLIAYTETIIVTCYSSTALSLKHKIITNLGLCIVCYVLGSMMASRDGHYILMILDKYLVASGLEVIILLELLAVFYAYGMRDFCDDVATMLGFHPNSFYQTVWMCTPALLLGLIIQFIYEVFAEIASTTEKHTIMISGSVIILPTICIAIYNCYVSVRDTGDIFDVFMPRRISDQLPDMVSSEYNEIAGPSRVFKEIKPSNS